MFKVISAIILATFLVVAPSFAADIFNFTDTWTDGAQNWSIKVDTLDTSSASNSRNIDLLTGGVSQFWVQKNGDAYLSTSLSFGDRLFASGASRSIKTESHQSLTLQSYSNVLGNTPGILIPGSYTASSGVQEVMRISPTYNQSSTAGATDVRIIRTETAVGSGAHRLIDCQVGGSTVFSVSNIGRAMVGYGSSDDGGGIGSLLQVHSSTATAGVAISEWSADTVTPTLVLSKSRGGAIGSNAIIVSGDGLGDLAWFGDDGADLVTQSAAIKVVSSGTIGSNRIPSELSVWTGTDAATTVLTRALTIDDAQNVGVGTSTFDGSAVGVLAIANGTEPAAGTAGQSYIYAKDVSTSSELHVMDEGGNASPISPHMHSETLLDEYGIIVNADDPMPRIEMTTNAFMGCVQISYTDPITHVVQTTHQWLEDSEMVDWDETQLLYKSIRDAEINTYELRKAAREDEILAYPALKAERDREQAAWEVLRQAAADETAAWKADKAADPVNFTDPPPAEFKIKQPPSLLAPTQFTEIRPADFVVKPELPYITRGKAIRARLK